MTLSWTLKNHKTSTVSRICGETLKERCFHAGCNHLPTSISFSHHVSVSRRE
jgi:hypothetical protein